MSSHSRRLADVLRIADNTCKALKSDADNSEYSRGLYNGFALFLSIFTNREYQPVEEFTKEKVNSLYEAIRHGDEEHQKWLKDKLDEYFLGNNNG